MIDDNETYCQCKKIFGLTTEIQSVDEIDDYSSESSFVNGVT